VVVAAFVLVTGACGDDANDGALQAQRAAELAAEFRASQTIGPESTAQGATTVPAVEPTGVVVPVVALDNSFRPQSIEIHVGDEVVWENRGANEHNVLSIEGDTWGVEVVDFQPDAVYAHVFTEPGEYEYFCSIHGNEQVGMVGTIVVSG
jgi:plastocyanin